MGIFKRSSQPVNEASLLEERFKLIGRELQLAMAAEYQSLDEMMKLDGRDPDSIAYEERTLTILSNLKLFLNEIAGLESSNQSFSPDWERLANLLNLESFLADPRYSKLIGNLMDVSQYYIESVKTGNFVMMPNANISNSKKYRSYLLGNNLNGDLNWGWNNDPQTTREALDSTLTQVVAKMVTSIQDKVGKGKTLEVAGSIGVAICLEWERSSVRSKLS